jgi:hypothetical protein
MSAVPCKSCGFPNGRLTAERRADLYRRMLEAFELWAQFSGLGAGRPTTRTMDYVREHLVLLLADDQGLCVLCVDKVELPR